MNDPEIDLFGDLLPAPEPGAATRGRRGAVPAAQWQQWIDDEHLVERYRAAVYWRGENACAYWLSSLSSTAHGKFRLGSRSDGSRRVVTAHVFGYQLAHGVLADDAGDVVVGHRCDQSVDRTTAARSGVSATRDSARR